MTHSTFGVSDFQYLRAFRELVPIRLLEQAVSSTSRVRRRVRLLPSYLVLGSLVAWFFHADARLPFITNWLCRRPRDLPSDSAIYQARNRLGWAPIRWLCRRVLRYLADLTRDPSAFYDGRRLLAIDGTTFTVADTPTNVWTFGRAHNQHGPSGYPLMRVVALCEVGTHAIGDWIARGFAVGEQTLAARLWKRVPAGSLLLGDRNFHCFPLWQAAVDGGWGLLIRVQSGPKFVVDQIRCDGSFLSWVYPRRGKHKKARAIRVRVNHLHLHGREGQGTHLASADEPARRGPPPRCRAGRPLSPSLGTGGSVPGDQVGPGGPCDAGAGAGSFAGDEGTGRIAAGTLRSPLGDVAGGEGEGDIAGRDLVHGHVEGATNATGGGAGRDGGAKAIIRRLFPSAKNRGHDAGTAAAVNDGDNPYRFFVRRVTDKVVAHGSGEAAPRSSAISSMSRSAPGRHNVPQH